MASMENPDRGNFVSLPFRIAAGMGFLGVALGAFGAHALKPMLASFGTADVWVTAVQYQLVHSVALLALAAAGRASQLVTWLWVAGVVVFSGSLYLYASSGVRWLGAITPLGGVALLAGWLILLLRGR
jgi:uncharacterized membrane protein YgdD (TMEM256/DUF423 family)